MTAGPARLDDRPEAVELAALERRCLPEPWTAADYGGLRAKPGAAAWVLRDGEGHALAFVCFQKAADELEIYRIAVVPERRRERWGGRLLGEVLAFAARKGASRVFLEVRAGNHAARRLYEAAGFRQVGLREGYFREPREDAVVLGCDLTAGRSGENLPAAQGRL